MGRRKGDWKCKFCNRMNIETTSQCYNCYVDKKGCGKKTEAIGNFGIKVMVPCGWQEEGFMPHYCKECAFPKKGVSQ